MYPNVCMGAGYRQLRREEVKEIIDEYRSRSLYTEQLNGHQIRILYPTPKRLVGLMTCFQCEWTISFIRNCDPDDPATERSILRTPEKLSVDPLDVMNGYFDVPCQSSAGTVVRQWIDIDRAKSLYTGKQVSKVTQTFSQHLKKRVMEKAPYINFGKPLSAFVSSG